MERLKKGVEAQAFSLFKTQFWIVCTRHFKDSERRERGSSSFFGRDVPRVGGGTERQFQFFFGRDFLFIFWGRMYEAGGFEPGGVHTTFLCE